VRIVVLGAGALGSLFGGLLSWKHDVTLIGRKDHVRAINKRGLRISGRTSLKARPKAVTSAGDLEAPDLLMVTVKAYDTETAIKSARNLVGPDTKVLSLQNGITTLGILEAILPKGSLLGGWTSHGVTYLKPGAVRHAGVGDTVLGELNGRDSYCLRAFAHAFDSCGIKTRASTSIRREIWLKGIVNASINPITAILRCENGELARDPRLAKVARSVCEEASQVATAEGHGIDDDEAFGLVMRVAMQTAKNRSSMLQDIEMSRRTEVDFLNGAVCELGEAHGIETPVNEALLAIVKALEKTKG